MGEVWYTESMKDLTHQAWETKMDEKELQTAQDENRSKTPEETEADQRRFMAEHFIFLKVG